MKPLQILSTKEKKEIERKLNIQFGIEKVPGLIVRRGEERLFLLSNIKPNEIRNIEKAGFIERAGIYFAKIVRDKIRLSIEGTHALKDQISKNIYELDNEQIQEWMMGRELPIKTGKRDFLVIKNNNDFFGCGKASEEKIGNYIPKSRRLKNR